MYTLAYRKYGRRVKLSRFCTVCGNPLVTSLPMAGELGEGPAGVLGDYGVGESALARLRICLCRSIGRCLEK